MTLLRWDYQLKNPVLGMSLASTQGGGTLDVQTRGFFTSDDGPQLYTFLDSFYECVLANRVPLPPEQISSVLVTIAGGTNVTAIVNPPLVLQVLTKGAVRAGDPVFHDHLADITEARIPGYELPKQGAIAYLFQHGWRRALYFDFAAHQPGADPADPLGDVPALLGSLHAALLLRDRIGMDPAVVRKMATEGWFPFARLSRKSTHDLYHHFENDWDPSKPVATIVSELSPKIEEMVESWGKKPGFAPHLDVLKTGARLFAQGEYVGAASTILPKLEGVLRHIYEGDVGQPRAPELRRHLVGRVRAAVGGYTALLPESFIEYLATFYYAGFDLKAGSVPPSRHAFLHGVGPDEQLKDPSYSLRLFLTLDQVFFCLSRMKDPNT